MTSPVVSVVLPTFNRLRYLRPAVDSVFAQTFTDWELIIADDGSDAATVAYLEALARPPRVRVIRLEHTGNPGIVRNAGVTATRGEYIAFLDSDDVWLPEKLARQLPALQRHPERAWSHTAFAVIDEAGQLLSCEEPHWWPAAEGRILERLITMDIVVAMPSVVVRRRSLEQVGGFDAGQTMCEDYDLWLRLAAASEIAGIPETLAHVRSHRERFHDVPMVLEGRARALAKLLSSATDRPLIALLTRERAKVAASLACTQAVRGLRRAALSTLAQSWRFSWRWPLWWRGALRTLAHLYLPGHVLKLARECRQTLFRTAAGVRHD